MTSQYHAHSYSAVFLLCVSICITGELRKTFAQEASSGSRLTKIDQVHRYPDGRPVAQFRLAVQDVGRVFFHGNGPRGCDTLGARDVWVWEDHGRFFMHYDGAGPEGWLACLATSSDLTHWKPQGPVLPLGTADHQDAASASYGVTFYDSTRWHMFYLGTPHTSPPPHRVPAFPYLTMKAEGSAPTGPWKKRYDVTPFRPKEHSYYSATASPGQIIPTENGYLMFFSASTDQPILRTIGLARTKDLNGTWVIDPEPLLPVTEQVENTSLVYDEVNHVWLLFTNHVGLRDGLEYTDAIWMYWSENLERWNPENKAVVLDGTHCTWSHEIIGLPSVIRTGNRLALFYDGYSGGGLPQGTASHMFRDVGLAWITLPLILHAP